MYVSLLNCSSSWKQTFFRAFCNHMNSCFSGNAADCAWFKVNSRPNKSHTKHITQINRKIRKSLISPNFSVLYFSLAAKYSCKIISSRVTKFIVTPQFKHKGEHLFRGTLFCRGMRWFRQADLISCHHFSHHVLYQLKVVCSNLCG